MTCNLGWLLIVVVKRIAPILVLERVDVHGSIGRLSGYIFIERIPSYTLDIVAMLGNLPDDCA